MRMWLMSSLGIRGMVTGAREEGWARGTGGWRGGIIAIEGTQGDMQCCINHCNSRRLLRMCLQCEDQRGLTFGLLLYVKRRVYESNNLHILFCLNHSSSSTNLKYEPNNKVPVQSARSSQGKNQRTSTSSSSSSQTMTSTRRFLVQGGIGFLLTCSTNSLIFIDIRSAAYNMSTCTAWREMTYLLWVDE